MIETLKTFTALSEEFVELFMKHHPVAATEAGIHDYDHVLPDDSPDGLRERTVWLRDLEQRLVASVPWDELPLEARVDFALLRSRIATLRAEIEEMKRPKRTPALFLERAFLGVHLPLSRAGTPADERKEAAVARLMAIPDYLEAAAKNLGPMPIETLEAGVELAARGPGFVDDVVRRLLRQFPGEAERLEHAGARARTGFLKFHDLLDGSLRGQVSGSFALTERWMNFLFEREHLLAFNCVTLDAMARQELARLQTELEAEARRVDSKRSWRELLADGRERHPEANWLREAYVAEMERARRFVAEHRVATLPERDPIEVAETPTYLRGVLPHVGYQAPAPFGTDPTGYFLLTPIDLRRDRDAQERQLQGHCSPMLPLHVLRLAHPGHHLRQTRANHAATRLRRMVCNEAFAEGWLTLAEDAMHERGFFTTDPLTTLFMLAGAIRRAGLAIVDIGLHTGRMTIGEATALLVDQAGSETDDAEADVRAVCLAPARASAALAGRLALRDLRESARRRQGDAFDLARFHDALLAGGTLPPALVGEEIWERLGIA